MLSASNSSCIPSSKILTDPNEEGLRNLVQEFPLPKSVSDPQVFVDSVEAGGVLVHSCGLASEHVTGATVTGAAAELGATPYARSYFELLERVAILDSKSAAELSTTGTADATQRYSSSNGVALATDATTAKRRALAELIERDRLLRSFYGETRPERLPLAPAAFLPSALEAHYELAAYRIPAPEAGIEAPRELGGPISVAAIFGFPVRDTPPLLFGFAARATLDEAVAAAARESLQQLAFGWGEPVPTAPPAPTPTPEFHLDYYGYPPHHARLRAWLAGDHYRQGPKLPKVHGTLDFLDITPSSLRGKLWVTRCRHVGALPLAFGEGHPLLGALPESMKVHPIA
jgi:hypothetical protein